MNDQSQFSNIEQEQVPSIEVEHNLQRKRGKMRLLGHDSNFLLIQHSGRGQFTTCRPSSCVTMPAVLSVLKAAFAISLPAVAGNLSGSISFNGDRRNWYKSLKKPSYNPPNWVFAPVWTTIYLCMGTSSYLIYRKGGFEAQFAPLALYGVQVLLNVAWSPIFFYFHRIDFVSCLALVRCQ